MMPTATAVIAEDEQHLAQYLQTRLAVLWPELQIVNVAHNGIDALAMIEKWQPTVAFLDIHMPGLNGIEVVNRLGSHIKLPHIVFVTAFDQYAVTAFERHATDYLLKPVTDERLQNTINRLQSSLQQTPQDMSLLLQQIAQWQNQTTSNKTTYLRWIRALDKEAVQQIPVDEVIYLQAQDKYVAVITHTGTSLIRTPLTELILMLDPDHFWQIHRSTVVNVHQVTSSYRHLMGNTMLRLRDCSQELIVSRAYQHLFKQM